jgi:hypothetical protein
LRPDLVVDRKRRGWPEEQWFIPPGPRQPRPDNGRLAERARERGLLPQIVYNRKRAGWPEELWFVPPIPQSETAKRVNAVRWSNGSLSERAREHGLSRGIVYNRKRSGWPEELWFVPPIPQSETAKRGNAAKNDLPIRKVNRLIAGLAIESGIDPQLAIVRVRRGESIHIACSTPPERRANAKSGQTGSLSERAREHGLRPDLPLSRRAAGWPEELWFVPPLSSSETVERMRAASRTDAGNPVRGSLSERAREHGLSRGIVHKRKVAGWPEELWFVPPLSALEATKRAHNVQSENSLSKRAREHGLRPDLPLSRRAAGWPEELWFVPPLSRSEVLKRACKAHENSC